MRPCECRPPGGRCFGCQVLHWIYLCLRFATKLYSLSHHHFFPGYDGYVCVVIPCPFALTGVLVCIAMWVVLALHSPFADMEHKILTLLNYNSILTYDDGP